MRKRNPSRSEPGRPGGSDTARARVSDPAHSSSAPPGTSHRSRPSDVLSCPVPLTEACHKTSEHSQARGPQSGETTHLQGSDPECGTDAPRGPAPVRRQLASAYSGAIVDVRPRSLQLWVPGPPWEHLGMCCGGCNLSISWESWAGALLSSDTTRAAWALPPPRPSPAPHGRQPTRDSPSG